MISERTSTVSRAKIAVPLIAGTLVATVCVVIFRNSALTPATGMIFLAGIILLLVCYVAARLVEQAERTLLGPSDLMFLSFGLKLFVVPLMVAWTGMQVANLPVAPEYDSFLQSHGLIVLALLAATVGYVGWSALQSHRAEGIKAAEWFTRPMEVKGLVILGLLAAIVGLAFHFVPPPPAIAVPVNWLRMLAPVAVLLFIFRWPLHLDLLRISPWVMVPTALGIAAVTLSSSRANIIYPLIAALAAFSLCHPRLKQRSVLLFVGLLMILWFGLGALRERAALGADAYAATRSTRGSEHISMAIQVYAGAPQFSAFALDQIPTRTNTVAASLLEPLPIVGKVFREQSGSHYYNRAIYASRGIADQVYPAPAELFVNWGLPGITLCYVVLGALIATLQREFSRSRSNIFKAFTVALIALLALAPVNLSLSVTGQFLFYNLLPLLMLWWVQNRRSSPTSEV